MNGWHFWIDRGGTFSDVVAVSPDGRTHVLKLLSEAPDRYPDAVLEGVRRLLGLPAGAVPAPGVIAALHLGTTLGTNALLQRRGARTALLTTRGFGDVLRIGYQDRPELFNLCIRLPEALYEQVIEVEERVSAKGLVLRPLDEQLARAHLAAAREQGVEALAVVLLHGHRYPAHEQRLGELARELGFPQVSLSSETEPLPRLVSRAATTLVDAYLGPVLRRRLGGLAQALGAEQKGGPRLFFMQSNGGLAASGHFRGRDSVYSGPAGGVVGGSECGRRAGHTRLIGFDMGGTSTDVWHWAGELERAMESRVAGYLLRAPMLEIHSVAAGGGSILRYAGGRLQVGPHSAGSDPGPVSYRRGGPLTVTDANFCTGRLLPDSFPAVFGADGAQPPSADAAREHLARLAEQVGGGYRAETLADMFLEIATDNMARAIKRLCARHGDDPAGHSMLCFGGAGAQHACRVAERLGMSKVLLPPLAGVLSAWGTGLASLRVVRERGVEQRLEQTSEAHWEELHLELGEAALGELRAQGAQAAHCTVEYRAALRYQGSDTLLRVPYATALTMRADFEERHRRTYGYLHSDRPLVLELLQAEAAAPPPGALRAMPQSSVEEPDAAARSETRFLAGGRWRESWIASREALRGKPPRSGPGLILEAHTTVVIEPGWRARLKEGNESDGMLLLERSRGRRRKAGARSKGPNPARLEVFNNRFMAVAEQMGAVLQRTATSVNIKERLDFSCALFDAEGRLVANAPHVPVHLGSMGVAVRVLKQRQASRLRPGQAWVSNDPYAGGTHLPDVTLIQPLFNEHGTLCFFLGARGHHADIGGAVPGSMPPDSRHIEEEGVLIRDFLYCGEEQRPRERELLRLLQAGPHPARTPQDNLADLRAQWAACRAGQEELRRMLRQHGENTVLAYTEYLRDNAAHCVREALRAARSGQAERRLDDGALIHLRIETDPANGTASFDFTGTSPIHPGNFNAPRAVTEAAVLYALRCLVSDPIPLNQGCLRPLTLIIPRPSLLHPEYPAAVAAGNVETSQAVVNCIFAALGVLADSQGTMNNLCCGNEEFQYYETLAGGAGAGLDFPGAGPVHTHMTNSRITDPEILEARYPIRVERFQARENSGGAGRWKGGEGLTRELSFQQPVTVSLITSNRRRQPQGLKGGAPGQPGRNRLKRSGSNHVEELQPCQSLQLQPGDHLIIDTPGGGGCGVPNKTRNRTAQPRRPEPPVSHSPKSGSPAGS